MLCGDGAAQIAHDLAAQGNRPLQEVPNAPGAVGKSYEVPPSPGYKGGVRHRRPVATEASPGSSSPSCDAD